MDDFHFGYIAKLNPKKSLAFTMHLDWVVLQMLSTSSFKKPSSKSFCNKRPIVSTFPFFLILLCPTCFPFSITTLIWESHFSSILWWGHLKIIRLPGLFLALAHFHVLWCFARVFLSYNFPFLC